MLQPALRCIRYSACATLLVPLVILALGLWSGAARGEDKPPLNVWGYRLSGSASVGYRFVDIDHGSKDFYREVVNLDDGPRLFDFTLRGDRADGGDSAEKGTKLLDRFHLSASSIGDPYPRIDLHLAKDAVYKF